MTFLMRATSVDDFVRNPVRRFVVGSTHLAWCAAKDLGGTVLWGRSSPDDIAALVRAGDYDRALGGRFDVVSDLSRVTGIDAPAYAQLAAYVAGRLGEYDRRVRRHAIVRPAGLHGAVVAGFNIVHAPRFEWRVLESCAAAFAWLERDDGTAICEAIEQLVDEVAGADLLLAALRDLLDGEPRLGIEDVAKRLGVAQRSLQRHLAIHGTSFRTVVAEARLSVARTLLEQSDEKIEVVARRAGFTSSSQFSRFFRASVGESPQTYRRRRAT